MVAGGSALMMEDRDVEAVARELRAAERERRAVERVEARRAGFDVASAYRVQRALVAAKVGEGERPAGYKMGLTSVAKQKMMGVEEPIYGCLFESSLLDDGAIVRRGDLIHPKVEAEIAFVLARPLRGEVTAAEVLAATEA